MSDPGQPRWLDEEQQRIWYLVAYALIRVPATLDAQMHRAADLSQFEYMVLSALSLAPGRRLRLRVLAGYTASTLARLGNVITRLEHRGWVRRVPDPADGRSTLAVLTDEGMAKVEASAPAHVAEVRRIIFDPLTKTQQRQLGVIAQRILAVTDPDGPATAATDTTQP
ncbi:MarR family winged helix-turn-helix transcriptional regulator [Dactylosporangium sp. NPDC048998]|uniref:MarR family winged helix-turn-helix transcriptional regulator n=1 Tax=Dactylosporangium sp. NPDC048998 TaxID=3363976 RepID=UPI00371FF9AB